MAAALRALCRKQGKVPDQHESAAGTPSRHPGSDWPGYLLILQLPPRGMRHTVLRRRRSCCRVRRVIGEVHVSHDLPRVLLCLSKMLRTWYA
jgi:hypothetical protein